MKAILIILLFPLCLSAQRFGAGVIMQSVNDKSALDFLISSKANISDPTQRCAVNILAKQLKGNSLWTNMQCLWPFVGGNATAHSYNLRLTTSGNLTFFNTPTQNSNGVDWNGTSQYATTVGFNVSNFITTKTAATLGYYTKDNATTLNGTAEMNSSMSSGAFNSFGIRIAYTTNAGSTYNLLTYLHDPSAITISTTSSSKGFYVSSRTGTGVVVYKDGTSFGSATQAVNTQNITVPVMIGASSFGGTPGSYTDKQCALAFIYNASMTAGEVATLHTIITQYQTILGRQN